MIKKFLADAALAICGIAIALFACEGALRLAGGFSSELGFPFAPVSYQEKRDNIEFSYLFKTNSYGLRYREIPAEKPPGSYRVWVAGDSFVEGDGISEGDRFVDLLEKQFSTPVKSVLFLSGGLSGTGPRDYGKFFLKVSPKLHSDALLICMYANDVTDSPEILNQSPFESDQPVRFVPKLIYKLWPRIYVLAKNFHWEPKEEKKRPKDFIDQVVDEARERGFSQEKIDEWKRRLPARLVEAVRQKRFNGATLGNGLLNPNYWATSIDIATESANNRWKNMALILEDLLNRTRSMGIPAAIVFIPTSLMYDPHSHELTNPWVLSGHTIRSAWLTEDTELQRRLRNWTQTQRVPYLDLTPVYRNAIKTEKVLNWELDGHWNEAGHRIATRAISKWLVDQHVFPFISQAQPAR